MSSPNSQPIGVFDSGIGGLTVLKELMQALPNESFVYFGDTARLPYGDKSPETILRFSIENTVFLLEKNIKMLVIACNTATAHALVRLQQIFTIPILGVIDPGAEQALRVSRGGGIAILATKGTIESQTYQNAIRKKCEVTRMMPIPCPLFVPLVEEQFLKHPATRSIVSEYLKPIHASNVDTVLLGCTHYPLLRDLIASELGPEIAIVDSASSCAEKVKQALSLKSPSGIPGKHEFYVSDNPERFRWMGEQFLGMPISEVHKARY